MLVVVIMSRLTDKDLVQHKIGMDQIIIVLIENHLHLETFNIHHQTRETIPHQVI